MSSRERRRGTAKGSGQADPDAEGGGGWGLRHGEEVRSVDAGPLGLVVGSAPGVFGQGWVPRGRGIPQAAAAGRRMDARPVDGGGEGVPEVCRGVRPAANPEKEQRLDISQIKERKGGCGGRYLPRGMTLHLPPVARAMPL